MSFKAFGIKKFPRQNWEQKQLLESVEMGVAVLVRLFLFHPWNVRGRKDENKKDTKLEGQIFTLLGSQDDVVSGD